MGKTPSSHIIHSLGGEYCWIVWDSEPIRLLKSPWSLSVYILNPLIYPQHLYPSLKYKSRTQDISGEYLKGIAIAKK